MGVGWVLPPPSNSVLWVILRAIYKYIIDIIQLLLSGGSTQGVGFMVSESLLQEGLGFRVLSLGMFRV